MHKITTRTFKVLCLALAISCCSTVGATSTVASKIRRLMRPQYLRPLQRRWFQLNNRHKNLVENTLNQLQKELAEVNKKLGQVDKKLNQLQELPRQERQQLDRWKKLNELLDLQRLEQMVQKRKEQLIKLIWEVLMKLQRKK